MSISSLNAHFRARGIVGIFYPLDGTKGADDQRGWRENEVPDGVTHVSCGVDEKTKRLSRELIYSLLNV